MNPEKLEKIFSLMKSHGVEYFKNEDLEIKMSIKDNTINRVSEPVHTINRVKPPEPQAIPPVDSKIVHHVNEVANLLKLDDYSLVDKLFPDYSQAQEQKVGE